MSRRGLARWTESHRPALDGLIGQDDARDILNGILRLNLHCNILCHGRAGVGKTSACIGFASAAGLDTLILNASNENGIDVVRNNIKTFVTCYSVYGKSRKAVILDECDAMSDVAQKALRKIMEDYGDRTYFLLTCNDVERVHPAVVSRCLTIAFVPLSVSMIRNICSNICKDEGVECPTEDDWFKGGDARRAINSIQSGTIQSLSTPLLSGISYDDKKYNIDRLAKLDYMLHTSTSEHVKSDIRRHIHLFYK